MRIRIAADPSRQVYNTWIIPDNPVGVLPAGLFHVQGLVEYQEARHEEPGQEGVVDQVVDTDFH